MNLVLAKNMRCYHVAEFRDGIRVLPRNWIDFEKKLAFWPHFKSDIAFDKAAEKMEVPESSSPKYTVKRILASCGEFMYTY